MFSLVIILCCLELFFVLGDSRDPHQVVIVGTTSGIRASRFRLGFLEIRRARDLIRWRSCVDLRSEVLVFVEIVCRSQKDARRARGICGGVDPERNSI